MQRCCISLLDASLEDALRASTRPLARVLRSSKMKSDHAYIAESMATNDDVSGVLMNRGSADVGNIPTFSGVTGRLITDNGVDISGLGLIGGVTIGNATGVISHGGIALGNNARVTSSGGIAIVCNTHVRCQAEENDNLVGDLLKRAFIADRAYATLALQMCARLPNVISQIIVDQAYVDPRVIDLIMNALYETEISTSLPDNHGSIWSISPYVKKCGGLCGSMSHVSIVIRRNGGFSWSTLGIQNIFKGDADLSDECVIMLDGPYDRAIKADTIDPKLVAALRHKLHQLL